MIIYGTGSAKIKEEDLFNKCSHCNNNTLKAFVYSKYVSVFWIPVFPVSKYAATQCSHCNQVLQEKQMPDDLKQTVLSLKSASKTPVKSFSGLIVFAALFALVVFFGVNSDANTKKYALQPILGDRYFFATEDGTYSSMKVAKIWDDSVAFYFNKYTVVKKRKVSAIDETINYDTTVSYTYSKSEVDSLLRKNNIYTIER